MQIIDELKLTLQRKGFKQVPVNIEALNLYYIDIRQVAYITVVFDYQLKKPFTLEQYHNILRQINAQFKDRNYDNAQLLSVLCTDNLDYVKELMTEQVMQWVIDTKSNRLVIYENQPASFLSLKGDIERILSQYAHSYEYSKEQTNYGYNNTNQNTSQNASQSSNQNTNQTDQFYHNAFTTDEMYHNHRNDNFSPYDNGTIERPKGIGGYFTLCNSLIIIVNILVYLWIEATGSSENVEHLLNSGGMFWPYITEKNEYYRLITHMFLHNGVSHIVNNMIVLFVIGDNLERAVGKIRYSVLYFVSGIVAGLVSMGYNMYVDRMAVSVGASGAIFGVVGAMLYVVIANRGRLESFNTRQLMVFVVLSLYQGLTSQGTDNMAHIGGFIAGFIMALIIYRRPKRLGGID